MKAFSYHDYIQCIHKLRLNAVLRLAEEEQEYKLKGDKQINRHDKLVKNILKDKREMANFINEFLEPNKKVRSEELEKYTNTYITRKYRIKEADLVYKLKEQDIFFLIEHQSTIDYTMPYRLLNYCIDIMQDWSKTKKIKKETRYPLVVPIIIYTGTEKWKLPKNFKEKQVSNYIYENYKISLEYNLIEINKLSTKFLLQKKSLFGYGMVLEKSNNKKELKENLELIISNTQDKKQLEEIQRIVVYLLQDSLEESAQEELLEKIEIKIRKGENKMSSLYERLVNENIQMIRKGKAEGKIEGKIQVAKKLLMKNIADEIILEATEISSEELEKIKQKISVKK